ncbi:TonB-dependent receptor [uncultured Muriicola sp.]|uniref:TonB-dependent receptor n=1 Tax=uncultured Muriicola sp. TaxID=1583102 RepID=UPI00263057EB|nr:TonB-dependent receptor [uncultured Muriicola sp.]
MRYLCILCCFLLIGKMAAQEIHGKLLDEYNRPIEGAYVFNMNSESHAHTGEMGMFKIKETHKGDSLKIGSLGFKKISVSLREQDFEKSLILVLQETALELGEVIISPKTNALSVLSKIDLMVQPVGSSQEILQKVPGLFIGQHAGGGKAEQLFLRGFDIDHGTDIALAVDGIPVNMVSHAHGQGYSDLHFVIPETIQYIDFDKGPYETGKGNFATAGYVDFNTKSVLEKNMVQFEIGDFGWNRSLGMFNVISDQKENAYVAAELLRSDGPFESSQNFSRINLFGKYTAHFKDNTTFSMAASFFTSTWDASGQIPQRAVDAGLISRFGAIDDTEGGTTSRVNINFEFQKQLDEDSFFKANAYLSKSDFNLFSNFTFFLEDKENGDQIEQKESRNLFGLNTELKRNVEFGNTNFVLRFGNGFRTDFVEGNELSKTLNRKTVLENIQLGDVTETNLYSFLEAKYQFNKFTLVPGVRLDHFEFRYIDLLQENYLNQGVKKTRLSPKLNLLFDYNEDLQLFLKSGIGFHSNDTRVSVVQSGKDVIPAALGLDIGAIFQPGSQWFLNVALWYLHLDQEFVYVGDAGIVEPSGRTERYGLDFGLRYQINNWLYLNSDMTYTKARSIDEPSGNNFIPLAPDYTVSGGITVNGLDRLTGGIRYRYLDDRPANEDNSIVAEGYFVVDMNANYKLGKGLVLGVSVQNLFNTAWNETQFATVSQLRNEPQPVNEIHFTPGSPFFIKGSIQYTF